jgi:hypothetical protein
LATEAPLGLDAKAIERDFMLDVELPQGATTAAVALELATVTVRGQDFPAVRAKTGHGLPSSTLRGCGTPATTISPHR